MLLELTHQTDLYYSDLISESVMELRVTPRQDPDQHRLSFDLSIGPATAVNRYFDWQGNAVHSFAINRFHNHLRIIASSVVETERHPPDVLQWRDPYPLAPADDPSLLDFLAFDGPVRRDPRLETLVQSLQIRTGEPVGAIVARVLDLVQEKFEYEQGVTTASSSITDVLDHGKGVCQDFTHLAIAVLRQLRIPARYVSGLVHDDTGHHLRGAAQTHAWCELRLPSVGWVGIDPTNRCVVDENFVRVGIGRHFKDVTPNRGVFKGKADESIDVQVTTRVLPSIPAELAGERFASLDIPAFAAVSPRQLAVARAAVEPQQQQPQQQQLLSHQQQQQQQ